MFALSVISVMDRHLEKKTLTVVFFTVFLDLIGFGIIIPIQPFFAELLGASPALVTVLGGSFSLMQFLFAPFWGRLSDRVGRRPIMLTSIAISACGYLLFGLSEALWMLFLARMLAGFGSANIGTAQAAVADITAPDRRARGMGIIGAAFGLGFTLGPAVGGFFVQFGLPAPALAAAALAGLNWVAAFFLLPETNLNRGKATPAMRRNRPGFSWQALRHAARHPNVWQLFLLVFVFTTAFSQMEQVIGLFIERNWAGGEGMMRARAAARLTAYVLIVIGITSIIVQGGLIGRLTQRFGERNLLCLGLVLVSLSLGFIPVSGWVGPFGMLLGIAVMMAVGSGITNPSLMSLLSRSVDADEQGGVLGLAQSLSALGRVVGPTVAGTFFELHRALPFWSGAFLILSCAFLALRLGGPAAARDTAPA